MNEKLAQAIQPIESVEALWGLALQAAGCPQCKRVYLVGANQAGWSCPGCATARLQPQPALLRSEPPELLVPFRLERANLLPFLQAFVKPVWLCPNDFNAESLLQRAIPIYWPMWLVDSDITADWQAEAGFDYQVKSSQESFGGGGWSTQERIETRVRWESRLGELHRHYDNVVTPALNEHDHLTQRLGAYNLQQAERYDAARLQAQMAGSGMRVPDLNPENAWPLAQEKLNHAAAAECQQAAGAQHVRNHAMHARYERLNWTQLLLPSYLTYYTDDAGKVHMVYINGQSGVVGGERLASQRKGWQWAGILAGIGLALFILGVILSALGFAFPPIALLGVPLIVVGLIVALCAILPAAWPWQWNRKQA